MPKAKLSKYHKGRPQAGGGEPRNRVICWRKMVLFSRAVKNDKVPGRLYRKLVEIPFSVEIFIYKFKDFLKKFQSSLGFAQTRKNLRFGLFISFRII